MGRKQLEINPGDTFPNKHWRVVREIETRGGARYFLCECMLCSDYYEVQLNSLRNENQCFCCRDCANFIWRNNRADSLVGQVFGRLTVSEKHSQDKNGNWKYLCLCTCSNITIVYGTSLTSGDTTSCKCFQKEQISERFSGENHHNWKDGISTQNELDRGKIKDSINPLVRERDNYTCQNCNQHGGNANCHHVFDFATYPELKFEESNLITLCKTCHNGFHKIYPKHKSNTLDNLESWLEKDYMYRDELLSRYNFYYPFIGR